MTGGDIAIIAGGFLTLAVVTAYRMTLVNLFHSGTVVNAFVTTVKRNTRGVAMYILRYLPAFTIGVWLGCAWGGLVAGTVR